MDYFWKHETNLGGPCLKSEIKKDNKVNISFDLSDCSPDETTDFIVNILTEHHTKGVLIDASMKSSTREADICISWENGREQSAQKVIKRIEMLSTSK